MFYNEDCISGCPKYFENNSVDLIITDPPYGISGDKLHKHYNRDEKYVIKGYVDISEGDYPIFSEKWIFEAERILKPGGAIYIIAGYSCLRHILNALSKTKLKEVNHIIWKYNFGVFTTQKYISSHYHILYYVKKGKKPTFNTYAFYSDSEKNDSGGSKNYLDREDVWIINREYKPGMIKNKNELPKTLLTKMILYSSNLDDLVCDFFLGSFSTAKVAIGLGRNACGFEINKNAFDIQINEINNIKKGELLTYFRKVPQNMIVNKGKPLSINEKEEIISEYIKLKKEGKTKKSSIQQLSQIYGRGVFSIGKLIKTAAEDVFNENNLFK
ncbi:MAG: site-specific DNA-methyltransferase [Marinilabiliaceae bacterium]|nr:site-specific DNA-methyltransferase [Marinilabiliaceae bacterium]